MMLDRRCVKHTDSRPRHGVVSWKLTGPNLPGPPAPVGAAGKQERGQQTLDKRR